MKLLYLDIETAPNEAYVWGARNDFIPADRIKETARVMCFSHLWDGDRGVEFSSEWKDGKDRMLEKAYALLEEADAVITYNGNRFDIPTLNREFLLMGWTPPEPYHSIDLFRTVKREFKFTHNKLDSVCQELGLGGKVKHSGFGLWVDVMNGDAKAQRIMERYNKRDVALLLRLYKYLLPWVRNHPNHALYVETARPVCTNCGSSKLTKQGFKKTKTQIYQQYKCGDCGTWSRERYTLVPAEKRHTILVGA